MGPEVLQQIRLHYLVHIAGRMDALNIYLGFSNTLDKLPMPCTQVNMNNVLMPYCGNICIMLVSLPF